MGEGWILFYLFLIATIKMTRQYKNFKDFFYKRKQFEPIAQVIRPRFPHV